MSVFAVATVKNEADVIEQTITRMLAQVDHVIVADNGSTDGTLEILEGLPVSLRHDPEPAHYQSRKQTALAAEAAAMGAEWIVPFDADEVWYSPFGQIAEVLKERPETIATAAIYNHVPALGDKPGPEGMGWREKNPLPLHKVACRAALPVRIGEGNHQAYYEPSVVEGVVIVRHFPYRSAEQMVRKVRQGSEALAATDLPDDVGAHWRDYGRLSDAQIEEVFREHFSTTDPRGDGLIFDPCPLT